MVSNAIAVYDSCFPFGGLCMLHIDMHTPREKYRLVFTIDTYTSTDNGPVAWVQSRENEMWQRGLKCYPLYVLDIIFWGVGVCLYYRVLKLNKAHDNIKNITS